jgi:hypothetical protein
MTSHPLTSPTLPAPQERPALPAPRRSALRRFAWENGLSLVLIAIFLVTWVGQSVAGMFDYNEDQRSHGQPAVSYLAYLRTGHFVEATAENWESEFLQMGMFVLLTVWLRQKGSAESKKLDEREEVDDDPRESRDDPEAPWPVRRGGAWLWLYSNSLSIAFGLLFLASFLLHAAGGAREHSQEQLEHGQSPVTMLQYMGTGKFWHESMQNWQSEFLSLAAMVVLTIWLRQKGSPESKPVAAPHSQTAE